jgi:Putative zinc-finger
MMHAIRCEDVQDRLEEFHDDELTLEQRVAIQSHLRDCVTCSLMAAEFDDLRRSLREAAFQLPDRDAPEAERLPRRVMERLRVEEQYSLGAEIKRLFQDMHLVWAALGATAAMLFCLVGSISVLHAASQERPDSLAAMITFLANPGSNENPKRLDIHMLAPRWRADEGPMALPPMPSDDAVLALSAVVTREGRIQNLELLDGDRPVRAKVRPDVLLAMLQAASQVEFVPAKATATGAPVAVSMVWVLANTTVKGRPTDDVTLVRRPPTNAGPLERVPTAKPAAPAPIARPATEDGALSAGG